MNRYILRFRGPGAKPAEDVEAIRSLPRTTVIDDSSRMLLVEAPAEELKTALAEMPGWVVAEERMFKLSDPRPKLRRSA